MMMPKISSLISIGNRRRITSIIFVNEIFGKSDDEISQKNTYVFCAVDELSNTMVPKM